MSKKGFTLVELIVTISILAILWTISYVSLTWYSRDARDAKRVSDIYEIEDALNLYKVLYFDYPKPTYSSDITYSWALLWSQWVFWKTIVDRLSWVSEIPYDPMTDNAYTYSLSNNKLEFEIATILEWKISKKDRFKANSSAWDFAMTFVKWNYNWYAIETQTWWINYVLAVPTIISWDLNILDYGNIVLNNKLAYNWSTILPWIFAWTSYNLDWSGLEIWINKDNILAYSWDYSDIDSNIFINNLLSSYSGSSFIYISDEYLHLDKLNNWTIENKNEFVENLIWK